MIKVQLDDGHGTCPSLGTTGVSRREMLEYARHDRGEGARGEVSIRLIFVLAAA